MDNIDEIMKETDRLGFGVSYGKYMAAHPNGSQDVVSKTKAFRPYEKPSRACAHCGSLFIPTHANQRYCCEDCREEVHRKTDRECHRRKSQVPSVAMCAICGADFRPQKRSSKYCCRECAEEGARKTQAAYRAAHKKGR